MLQRVRKCLDYRAIINDTGGAVAVGIAGPKKHHHPVHHTCTLDMSDARIELLALYLFSAYPGLLIDTSLIISTAFWWDLVVLALTVLGLRRRDVYKPPRLASVVCTQGVLYALISGISTLPVVVRPLPRIAYCDTSYKLFDRFRFSYASMVSSEY